MNTQTACKFFAIFLISITMLTSCSSDDDDNVTPVNVENGSLYDKWWYDSNDFTADLYFNSNGDYEQTLMLLGNQVSGSGNWTWEDEAAGIMKIDNLGGSGQIVSTVYFKFSNIQPNTFTVQQSTNGTSYSVEIFYEDTDN